MKRLVTAAVLAIAGTSGVVFAQQLDETWVMTVNGQTIQVDADGKFHIPNISAPDMLPQAIPGQAACCDFMSDDYLRILGVSEVHGLYAYSDPFRISGLQTYVVGDLTFSSTPPPIPETLAMTATPSLLTTQGQTAQMTTVGTLFDGSTQLDVTAEAAGTVYRSSNPSVAFVSSDGLVTAQGTGTAFITAVNEGAAAVAQVVVSLGDPLTTAVGFAYFEDGTPAFPGNVEVLGFSGATGVTDADGSFSVRMVPSLLGDLVVRVDAMMGSTPFGGLSAATWPMSGMMTDVGIVTLSEFIPVIITFDTGSGSPLSYTESSLTVTSQQDHLHLGDNNGDGSPDLDNHSGCCSTPYVFEMGGNPFNVISMEVVQHAGGAHTFTPSSGTGTVVTATGMFTFPPDWQGITSFSWDAVSDMAIDNLVIEATP